MTQQVALEVVPSAAINAFFLSDFRCLKLKTLDWNICSASTEDNGVNMRYNMLYVGSHVWLACGLEEETKRKREGGCSWIQDKKAARL